jgi:hypothetical protein
MVRQYFQTTNLQDVHAEIYLARRNIVFELLAIVELTDN